MATLIPNSLAELRGVEAYDQQIADLLRQLTDEAWIWYHCPPNGLKPRFLVMSTVHGLVGVDVHAWAPEEVVRVTPSGVELTSGRKFDVAGELGLKLEDLRSRLRGHRAEYETDGLILLPRFNKQSFVASGLDRAIPVDLVRTREDLSADGVGELVPSLPNPWAADVLAECRARLYPETTFMRPKRVTDSGRSERVLVRIQLEQEQECLVRQMNDGVCVVHGVAGSGKSLILAARARYLASLHPEWRIALICFNRALIGYLEELLGDRRHFVEVSTIHSWAKRQGVYLAWKDDPEKLEAERRRIEEAVTRSSIRESWDAILVDEGQDFRANWLSLLSRAVRRNRGGLLMVMDASQAIYHQSSADEAFQKATRVFLHTNYRNTEQIGRFATQGVFGAVTDRSGKTRDNQIFPEYRVQGEKVQVIWTQSWDAQAEFIAREIRRLCDERTANFRDIAVLFPTWRGTKRRLTEALEQQGIPHFVLERDLESRDAFDLTEDSVKAMTIHSAKGLEFPIVFLFGIETLKVPENLGACEEMAASQTRLAYVGMTRATDILYLTYTRPNLIMERAANLDSYCRVLTYPDDFV